MQDLPQNTNQQQELSIREHIDVYLRNWPWFIGCVIIALIVALIYLRYTPPTYSAKATVLIKNEDKSELAAFQDMGLVSKMSFSDFANEMVVLQSRGLTERVVETLNLNVSYIKEGNIRDAVIFVNPAFEVKVIAPNGEVNNSSGSFYILPLSSVEFSLKNSEKEEIGVYNFGDLIDLGWTNILVTPKVEALKRAEKSGEFDEIRVSIKSKSSVAAGIRSSVEVGPLNDKSSVILITLTSDSPEKARATLSELIDQYNADSMNDRNMIAQNTADFIQGRLELITKELDSVETGKVEFKEKNLLTNIEAEGGMYLQNSNQVNQKQIAVETQIALVNTMMDYLKNSSNTDLLPANLAGGEQGFSAVVDEYNQLIMERNRLLQSSTTKNPLVVGLDEQISEVRANVLESMLNAKQSLRVSLGEINREKGTVGSNIRQFPDKEKTFRSIVRQQEVKETLYLYLLQKREENAIAMAVTSPRAKVVDQAYSQTIPVKKEIYLLGAIVIGLLLPFSVIYLRQLLDNKIRNRVYLERHAEEIGIVGELPELGRKEEDLITENDTSILAESFRILSTNLKYLFLDKLVDKSRGKVIFVTSTVKGEGKTFVSANLAVTLANGGSKVVVVGADIRNPQLHRYINGQNDKGVVEYLVYSDTCAEDYLQPASKQKNLWLMPAGAIPPNPAELWMQKRTEELFNELAAKFDYVVVDTAPSMLVTDTLLINKYSDITIYTVRAGYTHKNLLNFPLDNKKSGKLKNLAFVLNNVSMTNFGYGNKYGYTYGQNKKTFWQRMFGR
ncbi:polysaccharide biosynthesis tyrosine autokinase [Aequorivita sp. KMM 9714]|uniref:GumC family protein n=1 Tax=Aequorivita sp. KMM 9714 TaxID=2707173 RepID=UPI0013EC2CC6|nr:polysaccharide biosynthesis tyrosine autokinase [Aequorivita sp. KMM 9714]NGX84753.1 polysaccharide biosynthesis tyrosine autokinase [Aequorivita sp. KMM 9714]